MGPLPANLDYINCPIQWVFLLKVPNMIGRQIYVAGSPETWLVANYIWLGVLKRDWSPNIFGWGLQTWLVLWKPRRNFPAKYIWLNQSQNALISLCRIVIGFPENPSQFWIFWGRASQSKRFALFQNVIVMYHGLGLVIGFPEKPSLWQHFLEPGVVIGSVEKSTCFLKMLV